MNKSNNMLKVVELFPALQGEGKNVGKNLFFIRVSGCVLNCSFCDTKYSWKGGEWKSIQQIYDLFVASNTQGLVLTGGSPLLYKKAISNLLRYYKFPHVELETNGVIHPDTELSMVGKISNKVTVFNVSPKLANSGNTKAKRYNPEVLKFYARIPNSIFKFVICQKKDLIEVKEIIKKCQIPKEKIYLMSEGATRSEQNKLMKEVSELAQHNGWNFSPRLHVLIYNNKRGV